MARASRQNQKLKPFTKNRRAPDEVFHRTRGLTPLTGASIEDMLRVGAKRDETPLVALTEAQAEYMHLIDTKKLTFGIGPAGTGKTYVVANMAADKLMRREVDRIIVTRPAVEAGEKLGFLPGELQDKFDPYLAPVREVLERRIGSGGVEMFLKNGHITALPLAFMRGHSFHDAFVMLDEAQNITKTQMKMFLTRLGENCTVVVDGDPDQIDIAGISGLLDAVNRLEHDPEVGVVRFTRADIVRSDLVQRVVEAYST